jgi:hypothetical protein
MKKFTQYLNAQDLRESLNNKTITEVSLVESKLSRVFQYVEDDKKDFGVLSAFRGANSDKENLAKHEELKKAIRAMGYGYIELRGGYKGDEGFNEELSVLVPNITKKQIIDLGRQFGQHSVMYKNDQDFYYIGTNDEAGVGKVLMRFKKGEGQNNLELAKHKVVDFFSQLKKGGHSDKKFVFNVQPDTAKQTAQGKEAEAKVAQRHRPGDIWKTSSGVWGGMDDQGNYEYFDDEASAKKFSKKHRKGYRIQEREEWNFAKAAYLRREEDPKWITIYEDLSDANA